MLLIEEGVVASIGLVGDEVAVSGLANRSTAIFLGILLASLRHFGGRAGPDLCEATKVLELVQELILVAYTEKSFNESQIVYLVNYMCVGKVPHATIKSLVKKLSMF